MLGAQAVQLVADNTSQGKIIAHKVVQTCETIEIFTSKPIPYYPGALISFVHDRPLRSVEIILSEDINEFKVFFGKITRDSEELILLAIYKHEDFIVGASTIISLTEDEAYVAETDVGFMHKCKLWSRCCNEANSDLARVLSTQEQVYQEFPQRWSDHYCNLRKVIIKLIEMYSSYGDEYRNVVKAYERLKSLLLLLEEIVRLYLKPYNIVIHSPRAIIFYNVTLDYSVVCDYETNHGNAVLTCEGLWYYPLYEYYLTYDGTIGVSISGYANVAMEYGITSVSYSLTWGSGALSVSGGVGYTWVGFSMRGLATWSVSVVSHFYQSPSEDPYATVIIGAMTENIAVEDKAELVLCTCG